MVKQKNTSRLLKNQFFLHSFVFASLFLILLLCFVFNVSFLLEEKIRISKFPHFEQTITEKSAQMPSNLMNNIQELKQRYNEIFDDYNTQTKQKLSYEQQKIIENYLYFLKILIRYGLINHDYIYSVSEILQSNPQLDDNHFIVALTKKLKKHVESLKQLNYSIKKFTLGPISRFKDFCYMNKSHLYMFISTLSISMPPLFNFGCLFVILIAIFVNIVIVFKEASISFKLRHE